ncbi:helix-turn-helix transcriptional regulator [Frigidibacter sp. MR17.24]|uniref:helix-turn-helix transcriptional regulator n=1 Tax=Frigidibacter sp. MR17.24 TaxID=3127345 RepID=UPI003012BA34
MTGAELAAIRKAAGLSQTELGKRVGIGRHAVSYWETKDRVDPYAWAVRRMEEVLDLPEKPAPLRVPSYPSFAERMAELDRQAEAKFMERVARAQARVDAQAAKRRVRCGAKTRKGTPCRAKSEPGKRRCKFHGGKSTGARTPEGRQRLREAALRRWARWRAAKAEACRDEPQKT